MNKIWCRLLVITLLVVALVMPWPRLAQAGGDGSTETAIAASVGGVLVGSVVGYLLWANRPGNPNPPDWEVKGPGGFYVGGFVGGSFVPSQTFRYDRGTGGAFSLPYDISTTNKVAFQPSVVAGAKLGYFFHKFPNFGIEGEFNYSRNNIKEQTVGISPALVNTGSVPNPVTGSQVQIRSQTLAVMTLALHFIARVGFVKTEEVPFGVVQPYVGIGPGFVILYGDYDAAKNFSLEGIAGVRFMLKKNVSMFVEYNISQQWDVELEQQVLTQAGGNNEQRGTAHFNFQKHHFVVGLCYHFL
ncbi:MAG: outer membrane beta-barrel protein [Syntrophobacterales bacterium]|jgi:opacity protein-like surface antigen